MSRRTVILGAWVAVLIGALVMLSGCSCGGDGRDGRAACFDGFQRGVG